MNKTTKAFKIYVLFFLATVLIVGSPFIADFIFLYRSYEISPYSKIISDQLEAKGVYGSAFNGNDIKYKVELVKQVKPEIVAIGSSRAMNVRDLAFTRSFVNCGGVSSSLSETETFVTEMLKVHKPKMVLYFVDYWWFTRGSDQNFNRYGIDETSRSFAKLTQPYEWLRSQKISWKLFSDIVLTGHFDNDFTNYANYGVYAIRYSSGFRSDGSYFNARSVLENEGKLRYYWDEIEQIKKGENPRVNLGLGNFVDEEYVQWFVRIQNKLKGLGIKVVTVLPPIAPLHLKAIRKYSKKSFVTPLVERLAKDVKPLYDFTDFEKYGANDCEHLDGYHIGDTASNRILKAIIDEDPNSDIKDYIDSNRLEDLIRKFQGHVIVVEDPQMYKANEYDFLALGCKKSQIIGRN